MKCKYIKIFYQERVSLLKNSGNHVDVLQSTFNFDFAKPMNSEDYPIEDKLFGDDMNEKIKNAAESIKHKTQEFFF